MSRPGLSERRIADQVAPPVAFQVRFQFGLAVHDDERHAAALQFPGDGPADPAVGADDEVSA